MERSDDAGERVSVTVSDGVAEVRLNRADKMNALDRAMFDGLSKASDAIRRDASVRAVVIVGDGRAFCAGIDLSDLQGPMQDSPTPDGEMLIERPAGRATNRVQQAVWSWVDLPMPVIAAVHGVAFGGGLQLALAADLRIVAPDARLSIMEIKWGLIPDLCGTYLLPRLVGIDRAKELTWTGRVVQGDEAFTIGLATEVEADPYERALQLARRIAGSNPDAVRHSKRLLNRSLDASVEEQLVGESVATYALIAGRNFREAVAAQVAQRAPVFTEPSL